MLGSWYQEIPTARSNGLRVIQGGYPLVPTRNKPGWFARYTLHLSARKKGYRVCWRADPLLAPAALALSAGAAPIAYLKRQPERSEVQPAPSEVPREMLQLLDSVKSSGTRRRSLGDSTCTIHRGGDRP